MNRADLQQLADDRIRDAKSLLDAERWSGAYYVSGYAVECGLKSCILAYIEKSGAGVIFTERNFQASCWSHELEKLLKQASLETELQTAIRDNAVLQGFWGLVTRWKENSRYEQRSRADAKSLYEAIADTNNGVLQWLRKHW